MSKEILARPYDPEVHGQFVAVTDHLGNIVDEKRFSFWPEIQGKLGAWLVLPAPATHRNLL